MRGLLITHCCVALFKEPHALGVCHLVLLYRYLCTFVVSSNSGAITDVVVEI